MYAQSYKYPNNREETKSNLTRTGQMALVQSSNQYDLNSYGNTGMNRVQNDQPELGGIKNQLKLLKSKMSKPNESPFSNENVLDQQTKSVNDQLSSLNYRLQDKQQPNIPRNRNADYGSPNQMSSNSTTNTNYSSSSKQLNYNQKVDTESSYKLGNAQAIAYNNNQYSNNQNVPNYNTNQNGGYSANVNSNNGNYSNYNQNNSYTPNGYNQQNRDDIYKNQNYQYEQQSQPKMQSNYNPQTINQLQAPRQNNQQQFKQLSFQQQQQLKNQASINNNNYQSNNINQQSSSNNYQSNNYQTSNNNYQNNNNKQQYSTQQAYGQQYDEQPTYQSSVMNRQAPAKNRGVNLGSKNLIDEMPAIAKSNANNLSIPEEYEDQQDELIECPEGCGRQFRRQALQKHVKICKSVFQSKREEFDSKEARIVNQEQAKLLKQSEQKEKLQKQKQKIQKNNQGKDPKWKKQSEEFRKMLQAGKTGEKVEYREVNELVECPSCGRKFNEAAAEKHIPHCQNKQKMNKFQQRR